MGHAIDAAGFRRALGSFATGVTIVTAVDAANADVGMTVNSFNSVSLEPPMVLWSINRASASARAFLSARHFAIHILASDQEELARRFSKRGLDRFAGLKLARGCEGIPLLEDCAACFQCRTVSQYDGGDHVILLGEVLEFDHRHCEPLVFTAGRFAVAVPKE